MESRNTSALSYAPHSQAVTTASPNLLDTAIYYGLFREAESVRWKMSDIPFDEIDADKVTPALIDLVKANAASELTTWTATNQFFQAFADDVDFTQWMTVWLYEETKHAPASLR